MAALLLLVLCLQDPHLLDRLGSDSPLERAEAQKEILKLGRSAYPVLKMALAGSDAEVRTRAWELAYSIGVDPASHRPWEEVWAAYRHAPDAVTRRILVRLSATVPDPRLTLLSKIDRGVFRELPACPSPEKPRPPAPTGPEWDVLDEVLQAALDEHDPEIEKNLETLNSDMGEPFSAEWLWNSGKRGATLHEWGLNLLQHRAAWRDVAAAWRCQLRLCPDSWLGTRLRGYMARLEQAAADAPTVLSHDAAAKLEPASRAEFLASQLTEARALDWRGRTCFCDGLLEEEPGARELVQLGRTAIPALLERLGSFRLTRMVELKISSHSCDLLPWTLHQAAEHVLRRIVGFYAGTSNDPENAAKGWREWWAHAKDVDEKTWWREWIEKDGDHCRTAALHRLYEVDPDQAAPWVAKALEKASGMDLLDIILTVANKTPIETVGPPLRKIQERPGIDPSAMAAAAELLAHHGDYSGVDQLRVEVRRILDGRSDPCRLKNYFEALAKSGRREDLTLVLESAGNRSLLADTRTAAFEALSWSTTLKAMGGQPLAMPDLIREAGRSVSRQLGDRSASDRSSSRRFCDHAAGLLRQWFPGEVIFKDDAPEPDRNQQIRDLQKWAEQFFE